MKRAVILGLASVAAGIGPWVLQASAAPDGDAPKVEEEVLVRATSSWNGVPYRSYPAGTPELTVMRMTIPARSALPWHVHGMPNAAYVLSGELTVEDKRTGKTARYGAGQALAEAVDDIHRGMTGDEPAVLILFYAGAPTQPPSVETGPE